MKQIGHPPVETMSLPEVLSALSDPIRLRIVTMAARADDKGMACCEFGIDLPKGTLSHHFKVLRTAGVIHVRPAGTRHLTTLRRVELEARFPGLIDAVVAGAGATRDVIAGKTRAPQARRRLQPAAKRSNMRPF